MSYTIIHSSGVQNEASSNTLAYAKREADKQKSFGGGGVSIADSEGNLICLARLWTNGSRFGWHNWETI